MKKKNLSKKEIKEINDKLSRYNFQFDKKDLVEIAEDVKNKVIRCNNEALFFYLGGDIIPSVRALLAKELNIKSVSVDMGAVKFVVNGADIMRPGIAAFEEGIEVGELVKIVDINNKKPLALGKALMNSEEMRNTSSGKSVENLHYIGDRIWNFGQK
jgi:PUA domain protein